MPSAKILEIRIKKIKYWAHEIRSMMKDLSLEAGHLRNECLDNEKEVKRLTPPDCRACRGLVPGYGEEHLSCLGRE